MTKEQKQEFTRRISQANKSGMIVILYDIFLAYTQDSLDEKEGTAEYKKSICKAKETIQELMYSINPENVLANNYMSIYGFIMKQLTRTEIHKNPEILRQLQIMVTSLRNTYEQVSKKDTSAPVMGNVETVYVGMTYGRGELKENYQNAGNRGFLV